ncbi:MAG: Gx transporter family protein [Thiohalomonadales bacterium]
MSQEAARTDPNSLKDSTATSLARTGTTAIISSREDHIIAGLAALAIIIHIAESAIPSPLPGIKPGLANVITMIALCLYGWKTAMWVSLLRVLVGSLVIGTFLGPPFFISLGGAVTSIIILAIAVKWNSWCKVLSRAFIISPIGLCILAAIAHMLGQFLVAYGLFIPHVGLFQILPILLSAALVAGLVTGIIAQQILIRLDKPMQTGC